MSIWVLPDMLPSKQEPEWERCPHHLQEEDAVDYFVTAHKERSYGGIKIRMRDV